MDNETDIKWFTRMKQGDGEGLRRLFDCYYTPLCRYVHTLIGDEASAEDIVQGVFIYLWEHRRDIVIASSVRAYLYASCRNKAMNHLRDNRKFTRFEPELHDAAVYEELSVEADDLHRLIEEAVTSLPEKCGKIFRMRRDEELSYKEIAEREGIAVKTVESQMHTALKRLKKYLATHLRVFYL